LFVVIMTVLAGRCLLAQPVQEPQPPWGRACVAWVGVPAWTGASPIRCPSFRQRWPSAWRQLTGSSRQPI
jgi:hypothetical protein